MKVQDVFEKLESMVKVSYYLTPTEYKCLCECIKSHTEQGEIVAKKVKKVVKKVS